MLLNRIHSVEEIIMYILVHQDCPERKISIEETVQIR